MSYWEGLGGRPRICWIDYVLAWECLCVPPEEFEEMAGKREIWASMLRQQ